MRNKRKRLDSGTKSVISIPILRLLKNIDRSPLRINFLMGHFATSNGTA